MGAVGIPPTVSALASPVGAQNPDATLLDLISQHNTVVAARNAHANVHHAAERRFTEAMPVRPAALTETGATFMACGIATGRETCPDGRLRGFYTSVDVDRVRAAGPVTLQAWDGDGQPLPPTPDIEGEARRLCVVAASDAWEADKRALADSVGLTAAEEEDDRLYEAMWVARAAIIATAPATLAGLRAKAAWLADRIADSPLEEKDLAELFAREVADFGVAA